MSGASYLKGCHAETVQVYQRAVERTIAAMEDHLAEEFSLEKMAKVGIMSPYHFNRVFRQVTGVPPVRFFGARRLAAAKRLLLTTSMSVTDICFEVGYNSLGTFTRRFTDLVGLPPCRFRQLARSGASSALWSLSRRINFAAVCSGGGGEGPVGLVTAPENWSGLIFVGLFKNAIPQGRPVACTVLSAAGTYRLPRVDDGRYYLFAVGLAWSPDPREYMLYENALRGGEPRRRLVVLRGRVRGTSDLVLRPATPWDPPILMSFPWLLHERLDLPQVAAASS